MLKDKNKPMILQDDISIKDKMCMDRQGVKGTSIIFIDDSTGNILRTEHNSTVIAGAQFTACKHFDIDPAVTLPNYNTELGITNMTLYPTDTYQEFVYLFCCGNSGCGQEASQVYPVKFHGRINPNNLIPFRYQEIDDDLNNVQRQIYFGRKEIASEGRIAYYYKAFDSMPQQYLAFADGTQIDANVYNTTTTQRSTCMVETRLKITKTDFRDWYFAKDGIENARINTLSLLTGWRYTDPATGYYYYNNVRPLTQLNFTNEWLIDLSKSITIVYQLFY